MGRLWKTLPSGKRVRTKEGYKHDYQTWGSTAKYKTERAARNNARRSAIRSGKAHKGDGTDVHHKNHNPKDNSSSNLTVMSAHKNRGINEKSRKKGSKRSRYGDKRR